MTDTDLRALFDAWLAQSSSAHRTCDVIGAIVRHHGQAMLALPTYPPQVRASAITHAARSPLLHSQDDFGRRHAARLDRREAWERGPAVKSRSNPARECDCPEGYEDGGCVFQAPVCPRKPECGPIIPRRTEDRA